MLYFIEPSEINVIEYGHEVNIKLDTKLNIPLHNVHAQPPHNNPTIVCKTNEYIELPAASNADQSTVDCGFGFCQETNQCKVLRVLNPGKNQHSNRVAKIHTLGNKSWRSIRFAPSFRYITSPTYLNGVLHWISCGCCRTDLVLPFEFSSECFRSLPQPIISRPIRICMGVIGDCLCLSATFGGVLIFLENKIIYYDPKREELKTHTLPGMGFISEEIVHSPSYISLKDVATGANTKSM
ncbi:F-box/kelch-repeat protein-like [Abeliophyllum distichum]|uniref:F-box/kelch-repeat protein-like n=1 Tax=Abeliophyllum distichum TaxID=126358 RepID=A0ABD1PDK6_9LAMI